MLVAALAFALGACSSSGEHASATTTTGAAPRGTATIVSFAVPASVRCGSTTSVAVPIAYAVRGARSEQIVIDGLAESPLTGPSGSVSERVHCDGVPHTVVLVALDANGARTSSVKRVTTILPGG